MLILNLITINHGMFVFFNYLTILFSRGTGLPGGFDTWLLLCPGFHWTVLSVLAVRRKRVGRF